MALRALTGLLMLALVAAPMAAHAQSSAPTKKASPKETKAQKEKESKETASAASDDPVVARVNGEDIHKSDVMRQLQMAGPQMQQVPPQMIYPQILQKMIATKIVSQKGYAAGMQNDADVKEKVLNEGWTYIENDLRKCPPFRYYLL